MADAASKQDREAARLVQVMLTCARVTAGFRTALFEAAGRTGMTPGEFALIAAGEKLRASGRDFPGVFSAHERDAARA